MPRIHQSLLVSLVTASLLAFPSGAMASGADALLILPQATAPDGNELAEIVIPRDQAITIAQAAFSIPEELGTPSVTIYRSQIGATWTLHWSTSEKERIQRHINVDIDALTGRVVSYSTWSSQEDPQAVTLTMDEARKLADGWFAKLVPADMQSSLRFVDLPLSTNYYGDAVYRFTWERMEQGYPVEDSGLVIGIDARTGELDEYRLQWQDNLTFTLPETLLAPEEADAVVRERLDMSLAYKYYWEKGTEEGNWRLVFQPRNSVSYVNQDGQVIRYDGEPAAPNPAPQLVPAADKPYQKPAAPLDQEAALAVAQAVSGRTDPPTTATYSESAANPKHAEWDFNWRLPDQDGQAGHEIYVAVDADTGVLNDLNIWRFDEESQEEPAITRAQAESIALEFIRTHRPDLSGQILYEPQAEETVQVQDDQPSTYPFYFTYLQNGVPVADWSLRVDVDVHTGEVTYFYDVQYPGTDDLFPSAEPGIRAEQALDAYLGMQPFRLTWVQFGSSEEQESQPAQLVWARADSVPVQAVDAATGAPLDWNGQDLAAAAQRPTDIAGHFAQREIEILWNRGVIQLADGQFRPDEVASVNDVVRWFVLAKGLRPYVGADFGGLGAGASLAARLQDSAESPYFGAAFQAGIMLPEDFAEGADLEGPVSRELFALWAARAMGYTRVAAMEPRIEMNFADQDQIGEKYANAVALLSGLGILSGDEANQFNPQAPVTRGEAAKILYAVSEEPRY